MKVFSVVRNKGLLNIKLLNIKLNISYDRYFVVPSQKAWTKTSSLSQIKFATLLAKKYVLMWGTAQVWTATSVFLKVTVPRPTSTKSAAVLFSKCRFLGPNQNYSIRNPSGWNIVTLFPIGSFSEFLLQNEVWEWARSLNPWRSQTSFPSWGCWIIGMFSWK